MTAAAERTQAEDAGAARPARLEVHKFGGTSVADGERIRAVADIVHRAGADRRVVVVVSAMGGVTDDLERAAALAAVGDRDQALALAHAIEARHEQAWELIAPGSPLRGESRAILRELIDLLRGTALVSELTGRARDRILACGEKLSARLAAAAISALGTPAVALDADTFLETDDRHGEASPLAGVADRTIAAAVGGVLARGEMPVITGFCGLGPAGATTTLGRGGSDLSATIVAHAIGADEATIWTDVDGVYSADPRLVPEARVLDHLNYREAAELSFYGAKVLYQRSMIPAVAGNIPLRVRNSFRPEVPGTRVDARSTPGPLPVKAVAAVGDHALITVLGKGMAGLPGVAARLFSALAERCINVTMISQASSESSITVAVRSDDVVEAENALKREFRDDLSRGDVDEVLVRPDVGLVAAVGLGMAHLPGVAAAVCRALGDAGVNIIGIAQGSSELNMTLAVLGSQLAPAVRALHSTLLVAPSGTRELGLVLLGCGKIGRRLLELLADEEPPPARPHAARGGFAWRLVGVADRSGWRARPSGWSREQVACLVEHKAAGRAVAGFAAGEFPGETGAGKPVELVRRLAETGAGPVVLVDVSDSDDAVDAFAAALEAGWRVVTANKKPLADDADGYRALVERAAGRRGALKAEATVGAGLPVLDPIENLLAAGDRILRIQGCLSGTLGFLMTRLEEGVAFSRAVAEAIERGYTEPEPVADLAGADVARKALILGRWSGLVTAEVAAELTGLVDASLAGRGREELLATLAADYDRPLAERVERAARADRVLRYVATVEPGSVRVGVEEVPADSPVGRLTGTDNLVVIESERYRERPLVIAGPGAGVDVTAMGVLGDLLRSQEGA